MAKMTMVQAINLALKQEMEKDDNVVVLGEDVGVDGGVFRVTEGLFEQFGENRVMDTPLAEAGIIGFSIGMALYGLKPVCEIQFSGFTYLGFHQLESHAARLRGRSAGRFTVPMVLRAPYGGGVRALEHHSESREAYFAHTPGLKMVIPSSPRNARALLVSAIRDPDPVVYFEPKALYRAFREEVPEDEETMELGRSRIAREGKDITLISYGAMLHETMQAASALHQKQGIEAEVIDLMTIAPLDDALFIESARKTGRVVVIHEAPRSFGPGAEVAVRLVEKSFLYLEAPIRRVTGFDLVIPLFQREKAYLPGVDRIVRAVRETLDF
ncbi:alpha-ketoacid dehydrogenase subunit beta [Desulfoferrobacter suflitae]|uniref:alpha-ketoacid dehydrogenase subunit beta n=1 Tax=Desulfoferrobacter suflitae TaxID=2865782 RepID=UPI00216495E6|nr:alpha-ketoacid dehydrogenase subunit beta [Desulfoferrobacter suflitae]MCK8601643.1 alpha-ketoacid dehydrogenase subunit beta [Desulfoferrobacter suflitae]